MLPKRDPFYPPFFLAALGTETASHRIHLLHPERKRDRELLFLFRPRSVGHTRESAASATVTAYSIFVVARDLTVSLLARGEVVLLLLIQAFPLPPYGNRHFPPLRLPRLDR